MANASMLFVGLMLPFPAVFCATQNGAIIGIEKQNRFTFTRITIYRCLSTEGTESCASQTQTSR
jgi:hypothetical protein